VRFEKFFLKHLKSQLREGGLPHENKKMTFVYGDTHRGGFAELRLKGGGDPLRVYNCGGWSGRKANARNPSTRPATSSPSTRRAKNICSTSSLTRELRWESKPCSTSPLMTPNTV
jgi:hypothetical protein